MNNKYLPLGIDLFFCLVLLPALIMLLPVERWLDIAEADGWYRVKLEIRLSAYRN